jgi:penicillin-binding protein 1C
MRFVVLAAYVVLTVASAHGAQDERVPSFEQVRAEHRPSDWIVADRDGVPLQRVRRELRVRRLAWISLAEVSPALPAALVAAEDKRFWEHGGVDWAAVASAAWDQIGIGNARHKRGASTLTMQLAGMLDPALRLESGQRRDLRQKWNQLWAARAIEAQWTKAQILEAYLNLVPWRGEAVGLPAAARIWFGKSPDGLDLTESALLVALLRQPRAAPTLVGTRACTVIANLDATAMPGVPRPDCPSVKTRALWAFDATTPRSAPDEIGLAPHAARRALAEWGTRPAPPPARPGGEPVLRTTLMADVQRQAIESVATHLRELSRQNVEDGAAIVIDNASGEIVAYVGSSGTLSAATEVDGVMAGRQAGSTLKPFLYGLAIEQKRLTAASLLNDSTLQLTAENGAYIPQNYDHAFRGWVSARVALASSLNIPAVRTLLLAGTEAFHRRLLDFGFTTLVEPPDRYGLALALGGADVRLIDLANAYRALANGGRWQATAPLTGQSEARPERQVMTPAAAFIVSDMLSDRAARALTFGLENALATHVWSAAKTGTSKDMRDNWCVGFTRRYTVGTWVGNFSGAPMWDVSGVQGAAPIWRDLIHAVAPSEREAPPPAPSGVKAIEVRFEGIAEPPRREWFLRGTETPVVALATGEPDALAPAIVYPADGLIVAIDPDIPLDAERLVLRMTPERADRHWRLTRLSGKPCQQMLAPYATWAPQPGDWRLELLDAEGKADASVKFSVRGGARHADACAAGQ